MLDLFIDLSAADLSETGLARFVADLSASSDHLREGRTVTVACHPSISKPDRKAAGVVLPRGEPAEAFARAVASAAARERGLAILNGAWLPLHADLEALEASSHEDPMIGTIQPRFSHDDSNRVACLPGTPVEPGATIPRAALRFLPPRMLTPELQSPLLVLSSQAVLALDPPAAGNTASWLPLVLVALRRRGFRNLIDNGVVVPISPAKAVYPDPVLAPGQEKHPWQPDADSARARFAERPEARLESILAGAFDGSGRMRLLLDCRGMQEGHNGTSQAILGFLSGFSELKHPAFEITVTALVGAARFHGLAKRFREFRLEYDRPQGRYLAAVLLNQPWRFDTVAELHNKAVFSVFTFLDTIAWDILYAAPSGLDRIWRTVAQLADGLLFISEFSRRRFDFRFCPDAAIPQVVTHLTLSPQQIAPPTAVKSPFDEPYLLLFGNGLDHKCVAPTLATLRDAFPFTRIAVIGGDDPKLPGSAFFRSGQTGEDEINGLVAHATAIVYPSLYEGFGLPVVHGLAHGRTVIVRRSTLWDEIAALNTGAGQLVPFHDVTGLLEAVGRALHHEPQQDLVLGAADAKVCAAASWASCSRRIIELLEQLTARGDRRRWLLREVLLRQTPSTPQ